MKWNSWIVAGTAAFPASCSKVANKRVDFDRLRQYAKRPGEARPATNSAVNTRSILRSNIISPKSELLFDMTQSKG
ncbi:MAG: hypothetical protein ACLQU2_11750 [Candidatus Binataceae bacterium]